jgi:Protein of unknown function (DUF2927)
MSRARRSLNLAGAALLGLSLLAGCDFPMRESLKPQARPAGLVPPKAASQPEAPMTPSARSRELAAYYVKLEEHLLSQGLLRRDGGGPDTNYRARDLARNFETIAFYDEHAGGNLTAGSEAVSRFHPWRGEVRFATHFGPSVSAKQRASDAAAVNAYASRLARVTGHPIRVSAAKANFHVIFASADDGDALKETVTRVWPAFPKARLETLTNLPRDIYCLVHTNTPSANAGGERAIAIIRAEHPSLMRLSCIHEELAQGLGLSNDSPLARPSIFNDDEEFATLTSHDELLLKMLYDPRLKSGMSLSEARPVITQIASELTDETDS